jgi:hypothetical protein
LSRGSDCSTEICPLDCSQHGEVGLVISIQKIFLSSTNHLTVCPSSL